MLTPDARRQHELVEGGRWSLRKFSQSGNLRIDSAQHQKCDHVHPQFLFARIYVIDHQDMMSGPLSPLSRRATLPQCPRIQHDLQQVRHATLIRRPKRPYTFTQLVTLSDGSTYLHRTTSPVPVFKATKDVRNSPLWNPSSRKLLNIEDDEAGKLAGFRSRFGRAWDSEGASDGNDQASSDNKGVSNQQQEPEDSLLDMIGSYQNKATRTAETKAGDGSSSSSSPAQAKKK